MTGISMYMKRFIKVWVRKKYLRQTIAFILSNTCCSTSVHWNGTSLDVRRVSGARISDLLGHIREGKSPDDKKLRILY
jgi:hypothetical protein